MRTTKKQWAAALLNAAIVVLEIVAVCHNIREGGFPVFRYYTVLSNVLAGIVSLLYVVFFFVRHGQPPRLLACARYFATCCLTVTFLVVVFVLAPLMHTFWSLLLTGSMLYQHLLCPLLSLLSFAVFERDARLLARDIPLSLIPTVLYGAVTVPLNIARVMRGPYPFMLVYEQPVWVSFLWVVVILGLAAGIGAGVFFLGTPRKKRKKA